MPSLCHTQVRCPEQDCCPGPGPEEELQAVQLGPEPAPSAEQSASYLDNLTCAICLDQIAPCNIASIPQCDHQYCGTSLLPHISPCAGPQLARCLAQLGVRAPRHSPGLSCSLWPCAALATTQVSLASCSQLSTCQANAPCLGKQRAAAHAVLCLCSALPERVCMSSTILDDVRGIMTPAEASLTWCRWLRSKLYTVLGHAQGSCLVPPVQGQLLPIARVPPPGRHPPGPPRPGERVPAQADRLVSGVCPGTPVHFMPWSLPSLVTRCRRPSRGWYSGPGCGCWSNALSLTSQSCSGGLL